MKDLHWLPIGACIDFKIFLLTFKIWNDLAPYYLTSLLLKYQLARLLHSSNRLFLQVPSVNTVAYGHCSWFSYYAPINWNSLPDHIKNSESVSSFKQHLKTFIFRNNYYINIEFHLDFIYYRKRFENSLKLCTIKTYNYLLLLLLNIQPYWKRQTIIIVTPVNTLTVIAIHQTCLLWAELILTAHY